MTRPFESPDEAVRRLVELHVRSCDLVRRLDDLEAASASIKEALAPAVPPGRERLILVENVREPGSPGGARWTTYLVRLIRRGDTLGCEVTEIDESEALRWPGEDEAMERRLAEMVAALDRVASIPPPPPPREVGQHAVEVGGDGDPLGDCPPEEFSVANARGFLDVGRALARAFDLPAAPPDPTRDPGVIDPGPA